MNSPKEKPDLESVVIKPYVGQTFYIVEVGNAARYNGGRQFEGVVTKVGHKYFTVSWEFPYKQQEQFCIDSLKQKTEYSATLKLYPSKQNFEDEKLSQKICAAIRDKFGYGYNRGNYTLETLKVVSVLLQLNVI